MLRDLGQIYREEYMSDGRKRDLALRQHLGKNSLFLITSISLVLGGCSGGTDPISNTFESIPRVNHYHNDSNQKTAEDASDRFQQFTVGTSSLTALLDKNLEARQALETTTSNVRVQVLDNELAKITTDVNWLRLRAQLLDALGMLRDEPLDETQEISATNPPIDLNNPRVDDARLSRLLQTYNPLLRGKIQARQTRVAQIGRALRLLAAAQQVLVAQAKKDVKAANDQLDAANAATKPSAGGASPDTGKLTRICFINELFKTFSDIATQVRQGEAARTQATAFQVKLLAAVEQSRDPASATALAAMVGTGLDDDSFALLDDYLEQLNLQLDRLNAGLKDAPAQTDKTGQVTDSWQQLLDAMNALVKGMEPARAAARYEELQRLGSPNSNVPLPAQSARSTRAMILKTTVTPRDVQYRQLMDYFRSLPPAMPQTSLPQARFAASRQAISDLETADNARRGMSRKMGFDDTGSLLRVQSNIATIRTLLVTGSKALRAEGGSAIKKSERVAIAAKASSASGKNADPSRVTGTRFLQLVLSGSPQTTAALNKLLDKQLQCDTPTNGAQVQSSPSVSGDGVKTKATADEAGKNASDLGRAVQGFVEDIQKQQKLAIARVDQFLSDLFAVELDINGENVRHANAMLTVAQLECKRWTLLGLLNDEYADVFANNTPAGQKQLMTLRDAAVLKWEDSAFKSHSADKEFVKQNSLLQPQIQSILKRIEAGNQAADVAQKVMNQDGASDDQRLQAERDFASAVVDLNAATADLKTKREKLAELHTALVTAENDTDVQKAIVLDIQRSIEDVLADPASVRLFRDELPSLNGPPATQPATQPPAPPKGQHPEIAEKAGILTSIRQLAEVAKFHHNNPAGTPSNGNDIAISNARLFKAVSTVSGHILMLSENVHMSEDNVIRGQTELAEHDLQLDALEGRIEEAGLRLSLGDIKAFHSSGVTDADIKSLETAFLGWIASKQ